MKTAQEEEKYRVNYKKYKEVLRNPDITPSVKALLANLIEYAGEDNNCFPTEIKLAKDFGLSDRQIRNNLTVLKNLKIISYQQRGFSKSNQYFFTKEIYSKYQKYTSSNVGNMIPSQSGNTLPPNVISNENQIKYSEIKQLFESISNKEISETEENNLYRIYEENGEQVVRDAIISLKDRNLPYIKTGLIKKIIQDFSSGTKQRPKPIFQPCGKCNNGFIRESDKSTVVKECDCYIKYQTEKRSRSIRNRTNY